MIEENNNRSIYNKWETTKNLITLKYVNKTKELAYKE